MRVKITLGYNGAPFFGSQIQKETDQTVNGQLTKALKTLHIDAVLQASGRTDRGVHATRQVVHVDLPPFWSDLTKLQQRLQHTLPSTIVIRSIKAVSVDFHARYSAKKRAYRYIISTQSPSPFLADLVTYVETLEIQKVSEALTLFEGKHNFEYFKKRSFYI